jgi:catechol 2,3-dioxygenase-like lactoylglutathione lyase family enzyme
MSVDYIMIGTNDLARARAFYDAVFLAFGGELDAD